MNRLIALALLAAFSFPLMSPLLAAHEAEAKLPACCRRSGGHKCGMPGMKTAPEPAGPVLRGLPSKCPLYPSGNAAPAFAKVDASPAAGLISAPSTALYYTAAAEQAEAFYRVSDTRSAQKRGPPSLLS